MDLFFDPTKENLSYTVAIIKPDTSFKQKNVKYFKIYNYFFQIQEIINIIESEGFIIKNILQRELVKEEIINIFYKHTNKPYFEEILQYMLSGESVILLLCHEIEDPIKKWKKIIGISDPFEAKVIN